MTNGEIFVLGFIIGLLLGALIGAFITCSCVVAGDSDENS